MVYHVTWFMLMTTMIIIGSIKIIISGHLEGKWTLPPFCGSSFVSSPGSLSLPAPQTKVISIIIIVIIASPPNKVISHSFITFLIFLCFLKPISSHLTFALLTSLMHLGGIYQPINIYIYIINIIKIYMWHKIFGLGVARYIGLYWHIGLWPVGFYWGALLH